MKLRNNLMADAVFEGGGVKGIGLVGAVAVTEERGYQWVNVAATSSIPSLVRLKGKTLSESVKKLFRQTSGFENHVAVSCSRNSSICQCNSCCNSVNRSQVAG